MVGILTVFGAAALSMTFGYLCGEDSERRYAIAAVWFVGILAAVFLLTALPKFGLPAVQ